MRKNEIIEMLEKLSVPYPIDEKKLKEQMTEDIDRLKSDLVLRYQNATNLSKEKQRKGISDGKAFFSNSLIRATATNNLEQLLKNCIMIRKYVLLKIDYKMTGKDTEEAEKYLEIQKICRSLSEIPSILESISEVELVQANSDWENSNLSKYAYKKPKNQKENLYRVSVKLGKKTPILPEQLNTNGVYAYKLGTLQYGQLGKGKGKYTYNSEFLTLLGIVKKTGEGQIKKYVGVMPLKLAGVKPEFYADVVFSDIVLENAIENNFGYIGTIEDTNYSDYGHKLVFEDIDIKNTIAALSYAKENDIVCDDPEITNLGQLYEYILENSLDEKDIKEVESADKSEIGDE